MDSIRHALDNLENSSDFEAQREFLSRILAVGKRLAPPPGKNEPAGSFLQRAVAAGDEEARAILASPMYKMLPTLRARKDLHPCR